MARKTRILAAVATVLLASLGPQKGFWTQVSFAVAENEGDVGQGQQQQQLGLGFANQNKEQAQVQENAGEVAPVVAGAPESPAEPKADAVIQEPDNQDPVVAAAEVAEETKAEQVRQQPDGNNDQQAGAEETNVNAPAQAPAAVQEQAPVAAQEQAPAAAQEQAPDAAPAAAVGPVADAVKMQGNHDEQQGQKKFFSVLQSKGNAKQEEKESPQEAIADLDKVGREQQEQQGLEAERVLTEPKEDEKTELEQQQQQQQQQQPAALRAVGGVDDAAAQKSRDHLLHIQRPFHGLEPVDLEKLVERKNALEKKLQVDKLAVPNTRDLSEDAVVDKSKEEKDKASKVELVKERERHVARIVDKDEEDEGEDEDEDDRKNRSKEKKKERGRNKNGEKEKERKDFVEKEEGKAIRALNRARALEKKRMREEREEERGRDDEEKKRGRSKKREKHDHDHGDDEKDEEDDKSQDFMLRAIQTLDRAKKEGNEEEENGEVKVSLRGVGGKKRANSTRVQDKDLSETAFGQGEDGGGNQAVAAEEGDNEEEDEEEEEEDEEEDKEEEEEKGPENRKAKAVTKDPELEGSAADNIDAEETKEKEKGERENRGGGMGASSYFDKLEKLQNLEDRYLNERKGSSASGDEDSGGSGGSGKSGGSGGSASGDEDSGGGSSAASAKEGDSSAKDLAVESSGPKDSKGDEDASSKDVEGLASSIAKDGSDMDMGDSDAGDEDSDKGDEDSGGPAGKGGDEDSDSGGDEDSGSDAGDEDHGSGASPAQPDSAGSFSSVPLVVKDTMPTIDFDAMSVTAADMDMPAGHGGLSGGGEPMPEPGMEDSTGMAKAGPGGIVRPKGGDDEQEELDGIDKEPLGPQGKSVGMLGKSGVSSLLPKLEPPGEGDPKGTGPKKFPKMGMPKEGKGDQGGKMPMGEGEGGGGMQGKSGGGKEKRIEPGGPGAKAGKPGVKAKDAAQLMEGEPGEVPPPRPPLPKVKGKKDKKGGKGKKMKKTKMPRKHKGPESRGLPKLQPRPPAFVGMGHAPMNLQGMPMPEPKTGMEAKEGGEGAKGAMKQGKEGGGKGMEGKSGKDESPPEMEMGGKGKGGEGEGANPPVGKAGKTYDDTFVPTKDEISGDEDSGMEDVGGSGMEDDGIFGGQEDSDGGDEDSAAAAAGLFFIRNRKEKEGSGAQKDEGDGQEEEGDSLLPPLTDEPLMVGADDLTTIPIPKKKGEINVNSAVTGIILEHDRIAGGGEDDDGENEMAQAGMGKAGKGGKGGFLMDRKGGSGDEDGGGGDASFGMLDESGGPLAKAGADMMGGGGGSIGPPTTHPISLPASQVSQKKITKTANQIYKIMEQIEELTYKLSTLYRPELISVRGIFVGNEKVVEGVTSLQEVSKTYEWEGTELFVIGGATEQGQGSIETLIPDSQQCPTTNAPPSDLYGAVGGVHDGFFVICGGMLKGGKPRDKCLRMSIGGSEWEEEETRMPQPRAFASAVMVPRWGMWIMGGLPEDSMQSTILRSTVGGMWMPGPYLPIPLTHFCAVTIPNRPAMDVYLYGGVTIKAEGGKKAVSGKSWSFHWQDQVWRHQPDMMYPRQGHDCISYLVNGGETSVALIVGGVNTEADAGNGVLPSEIFDFALGRFVEGPPLQQGVLHPKLVWVGEHIYLVGGVPADSSKESGGDLQGQTAVQVLEDDHWRITEINMKAARDSPVVIPLDKAGANRSVVCQDAKPRISNRILQQLEKREKVLKSRRLNKALLNRMGDNKMPNPNQMMAQMGPGG